MSSKYGTIGIIGGMGPDATNDFFKEIIKATPALTDQDHIPVLIDSNPQIPDRTTAILYGGPSPIPMLLSSAKKLEQIGANFFVIPCNTSHYLQTYIRKPIINMIEETVLHVKDIHPNVKTVGLLATSGTIKTGIYHDSFKSQGLKVVCLNDDDQEFLIMNAIYGPEGVKSGNKNNSRRKLILASIELINQGAEVIIMGCTEIPLVLRPDDVSVELINPTKILAKKAVLLAKLLKKNEETLLIDEEEE